MRNGCFPSGPVLWPWWSRLRLPEPASAFEDRHLCRILGGIEEELFREGYRLMFISNRRTIGDSREFLELHSSRYMDGLIVWGAEADEAYWAEVAAGNSAGVCLLDS